MVKQPVTCQDRMMRAAKRSSRVARHAARLLVAAAALAAVASSSDASASRLAGPSAAGAALVRAVAIQVAVRRWAQASTLHAAQVAAREARSLVTGPHAGGLGAADGGAVDHRIRVGLLPGSDGTPGLANPGATGCVLSDVLGGSWANPRARWAAALGRINGWTPANNTFPGFPSHAQRIVGWATLTLRARTLAQAHAYSGHATGHADVVVSALRDPAAHPCPADG